MEEWKEIVDYPNYMVSNFGNVKNIKTDKILKAGINSSGYYVINLCKNGKVKLFQIHRLVANAYIENPETKQNVDHSDGDKFNNKVNNLRWATKTENARNSKLYSRNTSGVKGVYWYASKNKWQAYITIDKIKVHLGYYNTIEEAKEARINKANEIFGDFKNACEN